jgi:hypothetical protein
MFCDLMNPHQEHQPEPFTGHLLAPRAAQKAQDGILLMIVDNAKVTRLVYTDLVSMTSLTWRDKKEEM